MTGDYTPSADDVREAYAVSTVPRRVDPCDDRYDEFLAWGQAEFDRWIEAHDRKVAAGAIIAAADRFPGSLPLGWTERTWLRQYASEQVLDGESER